MTNKVQTKKDNRRARIVSAKRKMGLKVVRGSTRARRRQDMAIFKAKQLARKLAELQGSTFRLNAPSLNINGYVTGKQAVAFIKQAVEYKEAA